MKTKQEYKLIDKEVYASCFLLNVDFEYQGKVYTAKSQYINGGWGTDDVEVYDDNQEEVYDEELLEIGEKLIYELEINKDTISY